MVGAIIRALFAVAGETSRRGRRKVGNTPGKHLILRGKNRGCSLVVSLIFKGLRLDRHDTPGHLFALVVSLIFKGLRQKKRLRVSGTYTSSGFPDL